MILWRILSQSRNPYNIQKHCILYQIYIMSSPSDILGKIQQLQNRETSLYNQLETSQNPVEVDKIIQEIMETSTLKDTLYHSLANDLEKGKMLVENKSEQLETDIQSTQAIEEQVEQARKRAMKNTHVSGNKARMVELGTYEVERYRVHKSYLQWLLIFLASLIVIVVLLRNNIIPSMVGTFLITAILFAVILLSIYQLYDMSRRSNMDYSKYNWNFDPAQASKDYQTVYDHDVTALHKLRGELQTGAQTAENYARSSIQ